jgi:hypothetical protein
MPKVFIRKSSTWPEIKSIFVKKSTGWTEVKNVFLKKLVSGVDTWVKVFTKLSLPDTTTAPSIRTTNTGSGTIYDGPVATSPQFLNVNLFGKDGAYTNYTSIFGRKFTSATSSEALPGQRSTVVTGDLFTSSGGVTTSDRSNLDNKYLFYELTVQNGSSANEIYPISSAIKMIKSYPSLTDMGWTGVEQVGTQLSLSYTIENYYYNKIDPALSYVRWWRSTSTNAGGTLLKEETISATSTGATSTSRTGTSLYTPVSADIGYYIVAEITGRSSYTDHYGYTDNYAMGSFPTDGVIGSALTFSNVAVKDYYDKNGLDNRGNWPTGTLNQYTGQLSGYDSNTVLRIRYRVYNYNTGLYWKPSTGTQTTASSAWDSWTSDGSGNGYISNVSVSGGVATFYDYFDLSADFFNGGGGTPATWWLEVELSAVRGGPRVYYIDPYETFYISKRIDPTVSVSPSTVATNSNVTISGSFAGFPATPSTNAYPRQYIVYYGDGNNSGYLPSGEWANGTLNPTYSLTKSYSSTGTYTVTVRPVPYGEDATASVTVANQLTAPTLNSVTPGPQGGLVEANFTGGSGPVYQMFWWGTATAPTTAVTPDGSRTFSPLQDFTGPSSTATQYMYVRSVSTAGETSVGPSSVASAWSNGIAFNMTSTAVSQNTAPTTRATSTFSSSVVKYLDSITWTTGSYTNAASITSVLLYSTVTSNLVSPGGNSLSSFRTANPYAIVPSDPAGTPYVFAVRDTVVGTNGTTYYFYSNQITSANADAVSFSYGTATSATGGWTASVNSGTQSGATYSYVSATAGSGSVNSSTGAVTASGLSSNQSSTITVQKFVSGYNTASTTVSGTAATVVTYTLSYSANGGSTTPASQTGAQGTSITLAANAGTRSGFTFGGWNIGGVTYSGSGSYTFGSANATATAIWNAVFVAPTSPAPSWTSGSNFQRITGSSILRWYTDYPSISGDGSIVGMEFQIRTTAGGGTLLASGQRAYPGFGSYPYSGGGTIWAFRCGTSDGDISYSSSARFARARVVMLGTNGTTYYGTYSGWI